MASLHGIIPPMTTPFDAAGEIDLDLLRADVKYLIEEGGVHGLAVGGSTGEGHTLSAEELHLAVRAAVDEAEGRIPIIAGIIVDSTHRAIEYGRAVADLDVAALQVTPVHYLFKPDDEAMMGFFRELTETLGLPVLVYNVVPWSYCSPELLTRLITQVEGVIGVKQSASDLRALADLMLMLDDRGVILSAVDALLYPSFALGAHGAIAAILTAVPQLCVELWDAVQSGDHATALHLHRRLLAFWHALSADNLPANVKYAMELQGRPAGLPRAPMPASSPAQQAAIRDALVETGVIAG